jgi:hypothetical protein
LHTLGNRFSPLGVSHLSVKSRQQYLLFSGQLYQIRNMYWRPIALQNTCNFNAARRPRERCNKPGRDHGYYRSNVCHFGNCQQ